MSTDRYTPTEYADYAGVNNATDVMKLAASLDPELPMLTIQSFKDWRGVTFWLVGEKRFYFNGREAKQVELRKAQEYATARFGIVEWGRVIGIPSVWFAKQTADAVSAALRTARREQINPFDFGVRHGLR